jgi:electron transfer flavoprotein beta subunit
MAANKAEIPVITAADLDVDENQLGLKGSPTKVRKIFSPERRGAGMKIQNMDGKEAAAKLAKLLNDAKVI